MPRIYAPVDAPTLQQIDQDATKKGISRAQWVSTAIEAYLHRGEVQSGADVEQMKLELDQLRTEREQLWRETVQLRRKEEQISTDAVQLRSKGEKLQTELEQDKNVLAGLKEELTTARTEGEKLREAMTAKDDEIAFLRGHVSQLTQSISQLALKPGEEEIRAKHWWAFWRR